MYTVYCHTFPNKKKYVGITCQKPQYRWNNGNGYKGQPFIYNAIQKYSWHNIEHKVLYENLTKQQAEEVEQKIIKEWKLQNKKYGYNLCEGGKTRTGYTRIVSDETKDKISKALKGNKNGLGKGKPMTQERKEKLSKIKKEKPTKYWQGKKRDLTFMHEVIKRQVEQYDKQNNLIKTYNSIAEAERELNIHNITRVCKGKQKTAGKFIWKYKTK